MFIHSSEVQMDMAKYRFTKWSMGTIHKEEQFLYYARGYLKRINPFMLPYLASITTNENGSDIDILVFPSQDDVSRFLVNHIDYNYQSLN